MLSQAIIGLNTPSFNHQHSAALFQLKKRLQIHLKALLLILLLLFSSMTYNLWVKILFD